MNITVDLERHNLHTQPDKIHIYIHTYMCTYIYVVTNASFYTYIQDVSRLVDITARGDFPGLCDQKSSYKHMSDFGRLRCYDRLKLRIEGKDY